MLAHILFVSLYFYSSFRFEEELGGKDDEVKKGNESFISHRFCQRLEFV